MKDSNLFDIRRDDALLDALAERTEMAGTPDAFSEDALFVDLSYWTAQIDASVDDALVVPSEPALVPVGRGGERSARRHAATRARTGRRSVRAGAVVAAAGAALSFSGVAAAVNGGHLPPLASLHFPAISTPGQDRAVVADVPSATATDSARAPHARDDDRVLYPSDLTRSHGKSVAGEHGMKPDQTTTPGATHKSAEGPAATRPAQDGQATLKPAPARPTSGNPGTVPSVNAKKARPKPTTTAPKPHGSATQHPKPSRPSTSTQQPTSPGSAGPTKPSTSTKPSKSTKPDESGHGTGGADTTGGAPGTARPGSSNAKSDAIAGASGKPAASKSGSHRGDTAKTPGARGHGQHATAAHATAPKDRGNGRASMRLNAHNNLPSRTKADATTVSGANGSSEKRVMTPSKVAPLDARALLTQPATQSAAQGPAN